MPGGPAQLPGNNVVGFAVHPASAGCMKGAGFCDLRAARISHVQDISIFQMAAPANTPNEGPDKFVGYPGDSPSVRGGDMWASSLFGCFGDIKLCLLSWCLPCIPGGRTLSYTKGGEKDCLCMIFYCLFGCLGCCFELHNRRWIEKKYGIKGSMIKDLLVTFCCYPCVVQQHAKQTGQDGCAGPSGKTMK